MQRPGRHYRSARYPHRPRARVLEFSGQTIIAAPARLCVIISATIRPTGPALARGWHTATDSERAWKRWHFALGAPPSECRASHRRHRRSALPVWRSALRPRRSTLRVWRSAPQASALRTFSSAFHPASAAFHPQALERHTASVALRPQTSALHPPSVALRTSGIGAPPFQCGAPHSMIASPHFC